MLADYIYDGIICLYNLALETLFNIATLNIYYAIYKHLSISKCKSPQTVLTY